MKSQKHKNLKPNEKELLFLTLAYNRFYDLYKKFKEEKDTLSPQEKFTYLKSIFQIYTEALKYEPIKYFLKHIEENRPLGESLSLKFFEIIRHILVHFPFFKNWDEIYITRELVTWSNTHSRIDSFFVENEGREEFKWRIWDRNNKEMKYGYTIRFPSDYTNNSKVYFKDLIDEDKGIEFSLIMIKRVLESQVEK